MIKRGTFFAVWTLLGAALSYAALYAFTPFGLALIGAVLAAGILVSRLPRDGRQEMLGLLAGPGAFFLLVASSTDEDPLPFLGVGAVILLAALTAYALAVRAHAARSA